MGTICEGSIQHLKTKAGNGLALRMWYTKRDYGVNHRVFVDVEDMTPGNPHGLMRKYERGYVREHGRLVVMGWASHGAYMNKENQPMPSHSIKVFMCWMGFHDELHNMLADPQMASALGNPEMMRQFKTFAGLDGTENE